MVASASSSDLTLTSMSAGSGLVPSVLDDSTGILSGDSSVLSSLIKPLYAPLDSQYHLDLNSTLPRFLAEVPALNDLSATGIESEEASATDALFRPGLDGLTGYAFDAPLIDPELPNSSPEPDAGLDGNAAIGASLLPTFLPVDGKIENEAGTLTTLALGSGTGLTGEYFDNADLTNLKLTRIDPTVNFNWLLLSPSALQIGIDTFSVRWTGRVEPEFSETYTFYTRSNDGARLWVNDELVIDNWNTTLLTSEASGTITLEAGKRYDIRLEYFDALALADIQLLWSSSSQAKQVIPTSQLYPVSPATEGPSLTAALANDAGASSSDGITSDPTIAGTVTDNGTVVRLQARLGDTYVDVTDAVQSDGSFSLSQTQLAQIYGGLLPNGSYTLDLQAEDDDGNISNFSLNFEFDGDAPTLSLLTPLEGGEHSNTARLIGSASDGQSGLTTAEVIVDGQPATSLVLDSNGDFDQLIQASLLGEGNHQVVLTLSDLAGNLTQQTVDFTVNSPEFTLTPASTLGWGAKTNDAVLLGEQNSSLTETGLSIDLGQMEGSRTLRFELEADFDPSDTTSILEDELLIYLVDPANPADTLLDSHGEGTALFSLTGDEAHFTPGLVRYDGTAVEIDLTSLGSLTSGQLQFQLLNHDGDTGSLIAIRNLTNVVDEEGTEGPIFPVTSQPVAVGDAVDTSSWSQTTDVELTLYGLQQNQTTDQYRAQLQVRNLGDSIGRNVAVVFPNLPSGVQLLNASGTDAVGNPYINLRPAIRPGGLDTGAFADPVELLFSNPNNIPLGLQAQVLTSGPNQAPVFQAINPLSVLPGDTLSIPLVATDADGDTVTFMVEANGDLPTMRLDGNGNLAIAPAPDEVGSYTLTLIATDGAERVERSVSLTVAADPITTTRISGVILSTLEDANGDEIPLAGVPIELGGLQTVTAADGSFTIESPGPLTADTLIVRGEAISGNYPYIAEKLPLVLGREVYDNVNNVITRPIYLPPIDVANAVPINPAQNITVTTPNIPGASVYVEAGSLDDQQGSPYTGSLSITEVPLDLTPAALPENLFPDVVVTIQPGEMVFTTPAPLTLPNRAGYAPGTEMVLWSINPNTGDFDNVGTGRVSADGSIIETIEGGIRNSSWHFFSLDPRNHDDADDDPRNKDEDCNECEDSQPATSDVRTHSGELIETHDLVTYQSLGASRGITLTYDSLRADPRPILHFGYSDLGNPPDEFRLIADLAIRQGNVEYQLPGYDGPEYLLGDGAHFWSIPGDDIDAALQADLRSFESGRLTYDLQHGIYLPVDVNDLVLGRTTFPIGSSDNVVYLGSATRQQGDLLHVNTIDSPYGSGWGIAGLQELVENSDSSILLIDGDGSEILFEAPESGNIYVSPAGDFSTVEQLADGTFRRTMTDQTVYQFDLNNRLSSVTDRQGNQTQYVYDAVTGQLVQMVDPVGLITTLSYNINGRLSSVSDPAGRITQMIYDAVGNLIQITDPDQTSRQFEYDRDHHMVAEVDQRGYREEAFYDFAGRVTQAVRKDGTTVQINPVQVQGLYRPEATIDPDTAPAAYDLNAALAYAADGNGNVTETELSQSGQAISSRDGAGQRSSTTLDDDYLATQRTSGRGLTTAYFYDERGNVVQSIDLGFANNIDLDNNNVFDSANSGLFVQFDLNGNVLNADFADFNGDNRLDAVVAINGSNGKQLAVMLNKGNGQSFTTEFLTLPSFELFGTSSPIVSSSVAVGDVSGDGIADIVLSGRNYTLSVLHGNGDGTFTFDSHYETTSFITTVYLADLTGDGLLDPVLTSDDTVEIFWSTPLGLVAQSTFSFDGPEAALGDLDGDGDIDLTDPGTGGELTLLVNNGAGQFQTVAQSIDNFNGGRTIEAADLDSDEDLDLAILTRRDEIIVLFNDGASNFSNLGFYTAAGTLSTPDISQLLIEDINLDRKLDLVAADRRNSAALIFSGNGDGTFNLANTVALLNTNVETFSLGDFNGDRFPDLGVSGGFNSTFTLFFNQSLALADVDAGLGRRYTYDPLFSQLTSMTDELGHQTLYDVDPTNGNRLSMRRVVGELDTISSETDDVVTTYTYTAQGLVDTMTNALGQITNYDYDVLGRLTQVTVAQGTVDEATQQFEYDAAGNLTALIDENGNRTEYEYDELNRLTQLVEADPDGAGLLQSSVTNFTYDEVGNLTIVTDARSNTTIYQYDELERLTAVFDANGETTQYRYDEAGNMVSVTDRLGHETQYRYDSRDRRVEMIDPEGGRTQFRYNADNDLVRVTDPLNRNTTYTYDARGRLILEIDPLGYQTTYEYDAANNLTAWINADGHRTEFTYDDLDRQIQTTDPLDGIYSLIYDKLGNVITRTDELNRTTTFSYDERNRLESVTDPLSGVMSYVYDDANNLLSWTDELNRTVTYDYDAQNRRIRTTDPLNHSTTYAYDATDNLVARTDALNRTTSYSYDTLNRLTSITNALNDTAFMDYDAVGNITAVTDELGRTTRFLYDQRNWQTAVIDPLAQVTTTDYDAAGNVIAITDALGHTTSFAYDERDLQTGVTDALGQTTTTTYDSMGNVLSITDPENNTTTFTYDALDRLTTETNALNLTRSYDYDAVGNLIEMTDRNGRVRQFTYDDLDRQTEEAWLDGLGLATHTITYDYDAASQLTAASDSNSAYAYTYDLAGRLTSVDNTGTPGVPTVELEYGYDAVNNLATVTDTINGQLAGTEAFTYDALNRMTQITQSGEGVSNKRVDMTYDAVSQMTGLSRYSDLTGLQLVAESVYEYDAAGRLTQLTHQQGSTILADYEWAYDAANRITQFVSADGVSDYSYDDRDQLLGTTHSYQTDESYSYDNNGNRTTSGYQTGLNNRLLSDGIYTYEYDNEGNRTRQTEIATGEVTEYTWDYRNRLTAVVTTNSSGTVLRSAEYTYDVFDNRIAKSVDADGSGAAAAEVERLVYDSGEIALTFDGTGNLTHRYLHGPQVDQILAEEDAQGEVLWALSDNQGTVRDLVDATGTVVNHISYDSFGNITSQTNPTIDFRYGYTGRELDEETGLYYYRARYYDAQTGQFVSEDPIGFTAGDANLYRYVGNSVPNFVDPLGRNLLSTGGGALVTAGIGISLADTPVSPFLDVIGLPVAAVGATLLYLDSRRAEPFNASSVGDTVLPTVTTANPAEFSPNNINRPTSTTPTDALTNPSPNNLFHKIRQALSSNYAADPVDICPVPEPPEQETLDTGNPPSAQDFIFESNLDSGLDVVPRPGMQSKAVADKDGNPVIIYGQAEKSSSTTVGHAEAMNKLANKLAQSGDYEYITLQRSWRTATGRVGTSGSIPDVIGVRRDGRVDAWEVQSKTDDPSVLRERLRSGLNSLPIEKQGQIQVIPPSQ